MTEKSTESICAAHGDKTFDTFAQSFGVIVHAFEKVEGTDWQVEGGRQLFHHIRTWIYPPCLNVTYIFAALTYYSAQLVLFKILGLSQRSKASTKEALHVYSHPA